MTTPSNSSPKPYTEPPRPPLPKRMTRIVVLGTGTGVGKTFATAELARALARMPFTHSTTPVKPIESGIPSAPPTTSSQSPPPPQPFGEGADPSLDATPTDADLLKRAATPPMDPQPHAYAFEPPISPHLAARQSRQTIDLDRVVKWTEAVEENRQIQLSKPDTANPIPPNPDSARNQRSWLLIETAGAAFTPLGPSTYNVTLAQALEPALWILVAPDRLGVLHDLKVTLETMRTFARLPDCVVLSQVPTKDHSTGTNAAELQLLNITPVLAVLANAGTFSERSLSAIWDLAERRGI